MKFRLATAALAASVCGIALAPAPAHAVGIYNGNGGVLYIDWLTMEECNKLTRGSTLVCFAFPSGGGSSGPVMHREKGEAYFLVKGHRAPVVVGKGPTDKALQAVVKRGEPGAFRKAFDAAYAGGSRQVDDRVAIALSRQFRIPIYPKKTWEP